MKTFLAFFKKELLESLRRKRVLILGIIFVVLGFLGPFMTWVTPILFELLSAELEGSGMAITSLTVNAVTSWAQFFENISMAMIAFFFICCGSFTKEYSSGTLILVLTKGLARFKVLLSKLSIMALLWTGSYWVCFFITYACNAVLWDNGAAENLALTAINWWVFGIFIVCLIVFFSAVAKGYVGVMLGGAGTVFGFLILSIIPRVSEYFPTALMNYSSLLLGLQSAVDYIAPLIITLGLSAACIIFGIRIFNKKEL